MFKYFYRKALLQHAAELRNAAQFRTGEGKKLLITAAELAEACASV